MTSSEDTVGKTVGKTAVVYLKSERIQERAVGMVTTKENEEKRVYGM